MRADFDALNNPPAPTPDGFVDVDSHYNDLLVDGKKTWKDEERVLLSLDGGGIRAVITIQMLIHIDHMLDGKLVEKIDDVAGTSCGGVIALLLSTNSEHIMFMNVRFFEIQTGTWRRLGNCCWTCVSGSLLVGRTRDTGPSTVQTGWSTSHVT